PGQVIAESVSGIDVLTGEGVLRIKELQAEGKRRMTTADFLNANSLLDQILK
ncbi:MAG: methionyl-tRNA formyltransferase, partial [Gammaproteobacteria bacterium]|nr:methionyl-tRNA formyltransferase [Gammaproteobacteria bacterium]